MSTLIVFTHLHPQWVPRFEQELQRLDAELLPLHRFGRSSTYRALAKTDPLASIIGDRKFDVLIAACYSAGYGYWSEVLKTDGGTVLDGIVTIDSWYASTLGTPAADRDLADLTEFARAATQSKKILWMTYSSIVAQGLGYAHTSEVAGELAERVGGPLGGFYLEPQKLGHGAMVSQAGPSFLARAVKAAMP